MLDPNDKPQRTDNPSITLHRQISERSAIELGYIGRLTTIGVTMLYRIRSAS